MLFLICRPAHNRTAATRTSGIRSDSLRPENRRNRTAPRRSRSSALTLSQNRGRTETGFSAVSRGFSLSAVVVSGSFYSLMGAEKEGVLSSSRGAAEKERFLSSSRGTAEKERLRSSSCGAGEKERFPP
ncbi:MAG: hypothetical protein KBS76_00480 [Ruminococcus sp.]|nr:hypothetical protein [Candidatus Apopatosoma intestinale]